MTLLWGSSMPKDSLTVITHTQSVEIGSRAQLECTLEDVPDLETITWVRILEDGHPQNLSIWDKQGVIDYQHQNFSSSLDQLSWKLSINLVAHGMSGLYQCQILRNGVVVSRKSLILTVLDPGKVEHHDQYLIAKHGASMTLDCLDFDGNQRGDQNFLVPSLTKKPSFIRVDRSDSGVYLCSLSKVPDLNYKENLKMMDQIPSIQPSVPVTSQHPGYPASLRCEISAVPVPRVVWYRVEIDSLVMIRSQEDISIMIDSYKDGKMTSSLIFENTTEAYYGLYSCNATNDVGQASALLGLEYSPTPVLPSSAPYLTAFKTILFIIVVIISIL